MSAELEELKATKAELSERLVNLLLFPLESRKLFGCQHQAGMQQTQVKDNP